MDNQRASTINPAPAAAALQRNASGVISDVIFCQTNELPAKKQNTMGGLKRGLDTVPVLLCGVFEKLSQLEWIFADFLDGGEQKAVYGDVNHLLEKATGLEEVLVPAIPHQLAQLHAGIQVVITVFRIDPKPILL